MQAVSQYDGVWEEPVLDDCVSASELDMKKSVREQFLSNDEFLCAFRKVENVSKMHGSVVAFMQWNHCFSDLCSASKSSTLWMSFTYKTYFLVHGELFASFDRLLLKVGAACDTLPTPG